MEPIENILSDLYAIDSSFKKHEGELRQLIRRLQLAKPDFSIDDTFVRRLRSDLLYGGQVQPASSLMKSYLKQLCGNLIRSSAFGAAVALILLVPLAYGARIYSENESLAGVQVENDVVSLGQRQQIVYTSQNAFGPIVALSQTNQSTTTSSTAVFATISPLTSAIAAASTTNSLLTSSSLIYTGNAVTLSQNTGAVLELDTSDQSRSEIIDGIQNLGFELTNVNSVMASGTSETIDLSESKPFGYELTVNPDTASIAIAEQPLLWPDDATLPNTNVVTDATSTINTAIAFLKSHNIDISHYGVAELENENTASSTATILLPLLVDNQNVYNPDGSTYGITITVDQIQNRVTAVSSISSQKYDASEYPLQIVFSSILSNIGATTSPATTTPAITASSTPTTTILSTPAQGLIHYTSDDNDFFIPGLIFPAAISQANGTTTISTSLVVPLLETANQSATST